MALIQKAAGGAAAAGSTNQIPLLVREVVAEIPHLQMAMVTTRAAVAERVAGVAEGGRALPVPSCRLPESFHHSWRVRRKESQRALQRAEKRGAIDVSAVGGRC